MIQKLLNELKDKHKQDVWHCSIILWSITRYLGDTARTPNPRARGAWPLPWLFCPTKCLARAGSTPVDDWPFGEDPGPPAYSFPAPPLCTARAWREAGKVHSNQDTGEETKRPWWEDTEEMLRRMLLPAEETGVTGEASALGLGLWKAGRKGGRREQLQGCLERAKHPVHAQASPRMHNKQLFRLWTEQLHNFKVSNILGTDLKLGIGRTDAETEASILWPPDVKSWLIGKDPDAGKDWRQAEKTAAEDEMVGWHHWLDGHESEQASEDREGKDREAWRAAVYGELRVSRTWLSDRTTTKKRIYLL